MTDAATSGALEPQNATNATNPTRIGESSAAEAFEASLQNSAQSAVSAQTSAAGTVSATSQLSSQTAAERLSALASQVDAGRLTMDQAVDRLLEQTIASLGAHLSTAQRAELSELLRSALATDPTLLGLRTDRG